MIDFFTFYQNNYMREFIYYSYIFYSSEEMHKFCDMLLYI